ncbi:MAG: leucine-rich repeat domain-containing protein [Bacteroidales bacterium]
MKKNIILHKILMFISILFLAVSCKDDDSVLKMKDGEGRMTFSFIRINGYSITDLTEIATVKITLEKDGIRTTLPSLQMSGMKDSISSDPYFLQEGNYRIVKYLTYDHTAALIAETIPTKDNTFSVVAAESEDFIMPIVVHDKIDKNNLLNTLYAICTEAFGEDRSLWPPSWNTDTELKDWKHLEFAEYEDGSIAYVEGLILDSAFAPMKKLSPAVVNLAGVKSLIIRDNALEVLPENFGALNIESLQISNTNLSTFPESSERLELYSVLLDGNKFTSIPEFLYDQKELRVLHVRNEMISEIPNDIANLVKLTSLNLNNLQITSIPDVFDALYRISTLDVSGNKLLSTLPASITPDHFGNQSSYLRAIHANGCAFTAIPQEVLTPKFQNLMFSNNQITSLNKEDLEKLVNMHTLYLSGNKLSSFPVLEMPSLRMLVLIGCGLTPEQVNREGMPNLYTSSVDGNTGEEFQYDFLFFTQDHFDSIFKGYEVKKF